jgi:hypothetical protein
MLNTFSLEIIDDLLNQNGSKINAQLPKQRINHYSKSIFLYPVFFYLVYESIGTVATPGLLCQPQVIVKIIVEKQMECRLAGETEVLGENLLQRHFCRSQNPT